TLVFDEVDAGVGGQTARAVGERLRRLAESRQVVCITHLPQIASLAERHFRIEKETAGELARTTVERLEDAQVVEELCRMLGADLFERLEDGETVTLRGGALVREGQVIAEGELLDPEEVAREYENGRRVIGDALEAFAENTIAHIREERELLAGHLDLPDFDTDFRDRPTLVVVRGVDHKKDLRMLRPYVRDAKPAIVAVDGGADAILEE